MSEELALKALLGHICAGFSSALMEPAGVLGPSEVLDTSLYKATMVLSRGLKFHLQETGR